MTEKPRHEPWRRTGDSADAVTCAAGTQAEMRGSDKTEVSHLLLAILNEQHPLVTWILRRAGVDILNLRREIEEHVGPVTQVTLQKPYHDVMFKEALRLAKELTVEQARDRAFLPTLMEMYEREPVRAPWSDEMHAVNVRAGDLALRDTINVIESEHLLIAIAALEETWAGGLLKRAGLDADEAMALLTSADFQAQRPCPPLWERMGELDDAEALALEYAAANHRTDITPEDLLSAMATVPNKTAVRVFERAGVNRQTLVDRLGSARLLDEHSLSARCMDIHLSDESEHLLQLADSEAKRRGRLELGFEDLFLGVLAMGTGAAFEALASQGLNLDTCRRLFEDADGA